MVDLATDVRDSRLHLAKHGRMSDDDIVADVASVRGIGPWTAQMYLISTHGATRRVAGRRLRRARRLVACSTDSTRRSARPGCATPASASPACEPRSAWYCWEAVHFAKVAKAAK